MKKISFLMSLVMAVVITISSNAVFAAQSDFKYAVVDIQKVLNASQSFKQFQNDQLKNNRELSQFIQNANKQLQAETDATKKQALEAKLNKELNAKRTAMEKSNTAKVLQIDKNVKSAIAQKAKQGGFDVVLAQSIVLYSAGTGTDITEDVIKIVK